jgi:hypothetical protein
MATPSPAAEEGLAPASGPVGAFAVKAASTGGVSLPRLCSFAFSPMILRIVAARQGS